MHREECEYKNEDHTTNSSIHFYLIHEPLYILIVSKDFDNFKQSQDSHESIKSWESGQSQKFIII